MFSLIALGVAITFLGTLAIIIPIIIYQKDVDNHKVYLEIAKDMEFDESTRSRFIQYAKNIYPKVRKLIFWKISGVAIMAIGIIIIFVSAP